MKLSIVLAASLLLASGPLAGSTTDAAVETAYLAIPSSAGALTSSKFLNSVPHYPGTPGDRDVAAYMRDRLQAFGLQASLESFSAVVYTPKSIELELLRNPAVRFDLRDPVVANDRSAKLTDVGLPFNAGSGNGDVTAPVVDAGRGLPSDYTHLTATGRSIRGKIALVRYGAEYRGNLALRAEQHGAAGVIFFTDPSGNRGLPYPDGPYPSDATIQRGVVLGASRRPLAIPVIPISARNAGVLLADMRDGQTTSNVHLCVAMNARTTTLWNTIGVIEGANPSQTVILGGHRDAWVYGVSDDGSGITTLLEVARGLGALHRRGWIPKRSIVIAGWDAEEIGSLGAGAYVTAHRPALERGCIAYMNTDEAAAGPTFGISAAGAVADAVLQPVQSVIGVARPQVGSPAGGSDFDSFIYTMGTPIVDAGYTGPLGTYHSPYDDLQFTQRFGDPGFVHHRDVARLLGIVAMRLAQAPRPLRFAPYSAALAAGAGAIAKSARASHVVVPSGDFNRAIARLEAAGVAADANASPQDIPSALGAARRLDLLVYSANGYAGVAFPDLTAAIATGKQNAVDTSAAKTIAELNGISASLEVMSR